VKSRRGEGFWSEDFIIVQIFWPEMRMVPLVFTDSCDKISFN